MKKGFTLIEILMGITVITIVILTCFLVFAQAYSLVMLSEGDIIAYHLAHQQIEFFRSGYTRVPPVGGPYDFKNVPEGYSEVNLNPVYTIGNREFKTTVTVLQLPGYPVEDISHVIVEVSRPENGRSDRKIVMESYISNFR